MNDIDDLLHAHRPAPRRPLRPDFTSKTIARLEDGRRKPEPRPWWKEFIPMNFIHKPVLAGVAVTIALLAGGTAYAAVNGWNVQTLFGGEKKLANGVRVVKVDAKNCPHIDAFNITNKNRSKDASYYYEIKAGSPLTNAQVVDFVTTTCEADVEGAATTPASQAIKAIEAKPENKDKVVGGYGDAVITAVDKDSITIQFPTGGLNSKIPGTTTQHFTQIDPEAVVTDGPAVSAYSALKTGDHVAVAYRASGPALTNSEAIRPDEVDASQQVVVVIQKLSPTMKKYYEQYSDANQYRTDVVEVAPCSSQPSGYCTDAQYLGQQ